MVSSNKILTVSYGTFSCTLEGFDDSFETMKAIAEYFRDLAQDDRYFGAEPPTPDAEMLARIAEREIERRVDARFGDDGGVVLRPSLSKPAAAAAASAAPEEAEEAAPQETPAPETAEAPETAAEPAPETAPAEETAEPAQVAAPAAAEAPAEAPAAAEAAAPAPEATPAPEVIAPIGAAPATQAAPAPTAAEDEDYDLEDVAPAPFTATPDSSVAAKLARIRAVVSAKIAPPSAPAPAAPEAAPAETAEPPEPAEAPAPDASAGIATASLDAALQSQEEGTPEEPVDEAPALAEDDDRLGDTIAGIVAGQTAEPAESVEPTEAEDPAKIAEASEAFEPLESIEDEAPAEASEPFETAEAGEPEAAEFAETEAPDAPSEPLETAEVEAPRPAEIAEPLETADFEVEETEAEAPAETEEPLEPAVAAALPDEDADYEEDAEEATDAPSAAGLRIMKMKRADFDRAVSEGELETVDDDLGSLEEEFAAFDEDLADADAAGLDMAADDDEDEDEDDALPPYAAESTLSEEEEADLAAELAALEAEELGDDEIDTGDTDADEPDADAAGDETAPTPFQLTPALAAPSDVYDEEAIEETEFDLEEYEAEEAAEEDAFARELDAAFAEDENDAGQPAAARAAEAGEDAEASEDEAGEIDAAAQTGARRAVKMSSPARAMLTDGPIDDKEPGVERILDETNREMEEPESKGRRSAIQHLRAAVAATRADRILGLKRDEAEKTEPYRADLANVVRPRRPEAGTAETARSQRPTSSAAPLKLVAEQRVDGEAGAPRSVQPRRVARPGEAAPAGARPDAESFAEYAERVGATELHDLLEAAAAYMAYVENRPEFSRPQLMTKLREAEISESSREDRLRSFGQLLRDGKIAKLDGGRFAAAEGIGFKPDQRAAG